MALHGEASESVPITERQHSWQWGGSQVTETLTLGPVSSSDPILHVLSRGSVSPDIRVSTASTKWMSARTSHARTEAPASTL